MEMKEKFTQLKDIQVILDMLISEFYKISSNKNEDLYLTTAPAWTDNGYRVRCERVVGNPRSWYLVIALPHAIVFRSSNFGSQEDALLHVADLLKQYAME